MSDPMMWAADEEARRDAEELMRERRFDEWCWREGRTGEDPEDWDDFLLHDGSDGPDGQTLFEQRQGYLESLSW